MHQTAYWLGVGIDWPAAVVLDPGQHLRVSGSPVLLAKRLPGEMRSKSRVTDQEAAANDLPAMQGVQLEEKGRSTIERHRRPARARLPEIDLVQRLAGV